MRISIYYALLSAELCTRVRETEKILNLGVSSSVKDAGQQLWNLNMGQNHPERLDIPFPETAKKGREGRTFLPRLGV